MLSESIITYLIYKGGIEKQVDKVKIRDYVKDRLYEEKTSKIKRYDESEEKIKQICKIKDAVGKYCTRELADLFNNIGDYRNDLNHAGYTDDSKDRLQNFESKLEYYIKEIYNYVNIEDMREMGEIISRGVENPNMLLLFSHKLVDKQKVNAKDDFGISDFIYLPQELQGKWSSIDPSLDNVDTELKDIKNWILETCNKDDYILIQGDYGAIYNMVNFAKGQNLIPIYSTSERQVKEVRKDNGKVEIRHVFEHVKFREY